MVSSSRLNTAQSIPWTAAAVSQIPPSRIGQRSGCARDNLRPRHGPGGGGSPHGGCDSARPRPPQICVETSKSVNKVCCGYPSEIEGRAEHKYPPYVRSFDVLDG